MVKKRFAASIKYNEGDAAPRLTAYGQGIVADKMLEIAAKAGVPLYREENLAEKLGKVEIGREIPQELYGIVAEVLSFIYFLNKNEGVERDGFRHQNR